MKTQNTPILLVLLLMLTAGFSNSLYAQSQNETGSSTFPWRDDYKARASIYGMKVYGKSTGNSSDIKYLFITDAQPLCEDIEESVSYKFTDDLEAYIEANFYDTIKDLDKYWNYGGLSGYTHVCYFYDEDTKNDNRDEANRGRTNAMAKIRTDYFSGTVKVIKLHGFKFKTKCN